MTLAVFAFSLLAAMALAGESGVGNHAATRLAR